MRGPPLPMNMHPLEALGMKDVPAHQTCDSLTALEWARADRARVIVGFILRRRGEVGIVGVWGVAEIRQGVQLDVSS